MFETAEVEQEGEGGAQEAEVGSDDPEGWSVEVGSWSLCEHGVDDEHKEAGPDGVSSGWERLDFVGEITTDDGVGEPGEDCAENP